jgi:hypothetical protein
VQITIETSGGRVMMAAGESATGRGDWR